MFDLNALSDFVAVIRAGSFTAAAHVTGIPKSTLSKRVQMLEGALGTRLIERTTRSLRLTAEGAAFHERAMQIMADINGARDFLAAQRDEPSGLLRITAPVLFGQSFLGSLSAVYARRYPLVTLDIVLQDRRVDLIEDGFDAGIRIGNLTDSTLVARKFADVDHVIAAPHLISDPAAMTAHTIASLPSIAHTAGGSARMSWRLMGPDGPVDIKIAPKITISSMFAVRDAVLAGGGIAFLPRFLVADDLTAGRLIHLLAPIAGPPIPMSLIYPSARFLNARVRAFGDLLRERFASVGEGVGGGVV
jgi:DNA-binding transcriptional LysR family regulator